MLELSRKYVEDKPIQGWLLEMASLASIQGGLVALFYGVRREPFPPGMLLLLISMIVAAPTGTLVRRFSPDARREKPVSAGQEEGVGKIGVGLALCSIGAFSTVLFGRPVFSRAVAGDMDLVLMLVFSFCMMLSLALGYASRHTRWGRAAVWTMVGWFGLLILFVTVKVIVRTVSGN